MQYISILIFDFLYYNLLIRRNTQTYMRIVFSKIHTNTMLIVYIYMYVPTCMLCDVLFCFLLKSTCSHLTTIGANKNRRIRRGTTLCRYIYICVSCMYLFKFPLQDLSVFIEMKKTKILKNYFYFYKTLCLKSFEWSLYFCVFVASQNNMKIKKQQLFANLRCYLSVVVYS